jgi:iron complex outermembrane recepter protein
MSRLRLLGCALFGAFAAARPVLGQSATTPLPEINVNEPGAGNLPGPSPVKERYQMPQTVESITAERIEQTINVVDTEDVVKYMPSLALRKRNAGDNQVVLASRVWGLNSSARTLVYADDILLSALIGNNNSNATVRWGMVAPEEIKRVDFLYGPFSAAYPGNSIGGVLNIMTRMPDKFESTLKQSESFQPFSFYKTSDTYRTDQTSASIGNRWGDFSAFVSFNYQNSYSQPLNWVTTSGAPPAGTTGTIIQQNRTGGGGNVLGAGGFCTPSRPTPRASSPGTSRPGCAPPTPSATGRTTSAHTSRPICATPPAIRRSAVLRRARPSRVRPITGTSSTSPTRYR